MVSLTYINIPFTFMLVFRSLSEKQKALILAYAEIESETPGTVNGITKTDSGKSPSKQLS